MTRPHLSCVFFFFNDTATTEIYTLSLHDALPICNDHAEDCECYPRKKKRNGNPRQSTPRHFASEEKPTHNGPRSEEHTSELQSQSNLVCRLLLEKKKTHKRSTTSFTHRCGAYSHT